MITVTTTLCDECATCISVCPTDAIILDQTIEIDKRKCVECGSCVKVCPFGALHQSSEKQSSLQENKI